MLASLSNSCTTPLETLLYRVLDKLQGLLKWIRPSLNLQVGDVICVQGKVSSPTKWPLARIEEAHAGKDGKVQVVTIRTMKGTYKCHIAKIVPVHHHDGNC